MGRGQGVHPLRTRSVPWSRHANPSPVRTPATKTGVTVKDSHQFHRQSRTLVSAHDRPQDSGRSAGNNGARSVLVDERNHGLNYPMGNAGDCGADEPDHDLGRSRPHCRLSSPGSCEGGSSGNCGRDDLPNDGLNRPRNDVRYNAPDDVLNDTRGYPAGNPLGGGGHLTLAVFGRCSIRAEMARWRLVVDQDVGGD